MSESEEGTLSLPYNEPRCFPMRLGPERVMNPEAPTPSDPLPEVPKIPPQAETNTNEIIDGQTANAIGSNPVEKPSIENSPAVDSPLNITTAHPAKTKIQTITFHHDPEGDEDSRKHKKLRTRLKKMLVYLVYLILLPLAFVVYLNVVCGNSFKSNHGHW